jgi:crossover junction endodeoxyribonuclease RuvC
MSEGPGSIPLAEAAVVLGVDPGLRRTGWGVLRREGPRVSWVAHGVIAPPPEAPLAARLAEVARGLRAVLAAHAPHEAAVEETFMANNARSALLLGHARGVALATLAEAGLTVAEYGARHVKKALVGTGAAEKDQVAFMVRRLLPGSGMVDADAADALAVALCHAAHGRSPAKAAVAPSRAGATRLRVAR